MGVSIDWQTDRVFVASAILHQVRMFLASGKELAAMSGFNFPNQIHFQDQRLYVADTNHHIVAAIAADGDRLLVDPENRFANAKFYQNENIWPSSFLVIGDQIWIGNARDNTEHDNIYICDTKGYFIKRLKLPETGNPYALMQLGKTVLVSDVSLGKIYQFSLEGEALPNFEPKAFKAILSELKNKKEWFQNFDLAFTSLFTFGLVSGFVYGLQQQKGGNPFSIESAVAKSLALREVVNVKGAAMSPKCKHGMDVFWMRQRFRFKMFWLTVALTELLMLAAIAAILYFIKVPILYPGYPLDWSKHYMLW